MCHFERLDTSEPTKNWKETKNAINVLEIWGIPILSFLLIIDLDLDLDFIY